MHHLSPLFVMFAGALRRHAFLSLAVLGTLALLIPGTLRAADTGSPSASAPQPYVATLNLTQAAAATAGSVDSTQHSEVFAVFTGFFTADTSAAGIRRQVDSNGGFSVGYRYHFNDWAGAELRYGFARNTSKYFQMGTSTQFPVQANIHEGTANFVLSTPRIFGVLKPYVLAGGGALVFRPTNAAGGFTVGNRAQVKGIVDYGAGLTLFPWSHVGIRAEYRGLIYNVPSFKLSTLEQSVHTHTAEPALGLVVTW